MWLITQLGRMINTDRLQTIDPDPRDEKKVVGYFDAERSYLLGKFQNSDHAKAVIRYIGGAYRGNMKLIQMPMTWPLEDERKD